MAYKARAVAAHQSAPYGKMLICTGEQLQVEHRPSEWPGWVWVTTLNQISGWMPLAFLQKTEAGWQALRDYRDIELNVSPGEELEVLSTQDGWAWCVQSNQKTGWVPLEVLESWK